MSSKITTKRIKKDDVFEAVQAYNSKFDAEKLPFRFEYLRKQNQISLYHNEKHLESFKEKTSELIPVLEREYNNVRTDYYTKFALSFRIDTNGNKTLTVRNTSLKCTLSVQTNGNLPELHRCSELPHSRTIFNELIPYVAEFGTASQKRCLELSGVV